jgi:AhpD family alkylhydroperoxidase
MRSAAMAAIESLSDWSGPRELTPRLNLHDAAPESMEEMISFQEFIGARTFDTMFLELVRTYVSHLNRCVYGIDRHTRRARGCGETEERLRLLPAWRPTALYSERERAAFAWAECLTRSVAEVSDREFQQAREWFTEEELVDLTFAVVETQAWNRFAIAFRQPPAPARGRLLESLSATPRRGRLTREAAEQFA